MSVPWLEPQILIESEMTLFYECMLKCAQKVPDTADIVREAIHYQLWWSPFTEKLLRSSYSRPCP